MFQYVRLYDGLKRNKYSYGNADRIGHQPSPRHHSRRQHASESVAADSAASMAVIAISAECGRQFLAMHGPAFLF